MRAKTPPPDLTPAERFFHDNAPYSWDPKTQTAEQGRAETARALAAAEARASSDGYDTAWRPDPEGDANGEHPAWIAELYGPDGQPAPGAALGGVTFGGDGEPWGTPYARVVAAQLAAQALTT